MVINEKIQKSRLDLSEKMKDVKVYISRTCRLPNEENHEKSIIGLEKLQFYFGSQEFLRNAIL